MRRPQRRAAILAASVIAVGTAGFTASAAADPAPAAEKGGARGARVGFLLQSQLNSLCLDVSNGNAGDGALLTTWECHGAPGQRFTWEGGKLRNDHSGKCLDIVAGNPHQGAAVQMYTCRDDRTAQKWTWAGTDAPLVSVHNNLCLDISGGNRAQGAAIQMWGCHNHPAQKWRTS
ncbi:RICIN domain-containing protein [Streptomyces sp. NPDC017940]|uniref:RICIN domain-containing protein n=1 Tax=Streptomyces sp. NPDC017940 TaxID=3365017 RepID=UPI00379A8E34